MTYKDKGSCESLPPCISLVRRTSRSSGYYWAESHKESVLASECGQDRMSLVQKFSCVCCAKWYCWYCLAHGYKFTWMYLSRVAYDQIAINMTAAQRQNVQGVRIMACQCMERLEWRDQMWRTLVLIHGQTYSSLARRGVVCVRACICAVNAAVREAFWEHVFARSDLR